MSKYWESTTRCSGTGECKVLKVVREKGTRILQCKYSCSSTLQKQPEEGSPETVINLEIIEKYSKSSLLYKCSENLIICKKKRATIKYGVQITFKHVRKKVWDVER